MVANIKLKRSAVAGRIPPELDYGELALNYSDGILYYKNNASEIASISGGGATTDSAAPSSGASLRDGGLWWDATSGRLKVYYDDGADSAQWVDAAPAGKGYTGSAGAITFSETAPTSPSDGQIWYNSTSGKSYMYYENGGNRAWILFADPTVSDGVIGYTGSAGYSGSQGSISPRMVSILSPSASSEATLIFTPTEITISEVKATIRGTSCNYAVKYASARNAAGTTVATENTTSNTTGSTPTITSAVVPANNYIWVEVIAAVACDELALNVIF